VFILKLCREWNEIHFVRGECDEVSAFSDRSETAAERENSESSRKGKTRLVACTPHATTLPQTSNIVSRAENESISDKSCGFR
jgi:hypothetical protein